MGPAETIEKLIRNFFATKKSRIAISAEFDKAVLDDVLAAYEKSMVTKTISAKPNIWRIIMKSPITKFAAAACVIVAVTFGLTTVLSKSVSTAYAIEQTIQANHGINYLHVKSYDPSHEEPKEEIWVEFDPTGQVRNMRAYVPEWASSVESGPVVMVWKEGRTQVWIKKKNVFVVTADKSLAKQALRMAENVDPKLTVERLSSVQTDAKIKIDINQPSNKTEPIVITSTWVPDPDKLYDEQELYRRLNSSTGLPPNTRGMLFIDQATKLVTSSQLYLLKKDGYQLVSMLEYYDYNQPIEPKMFTLDDEVPANAMRIDQTTREVGMVQGNLNQEEVVVEVARQSFQALIDKDYAKAGRLLEGMSAEQMRERSGKTDFIRIISIGKPTSHPMPASRCMRVPCEIEVENNGVKSVKKFSLLIHEVYGQPGHWAVIGGI